jgi:hypothetical protein
LQVAAAVTATCSKFYLNIALLLQVGIGLYDEVTSQPGMASYMAVSEIVVGVLFTVEVTIKILAEGSL